MSRNEPGADAVHDVALVDLVNRVLDRGVVLRGEIVVSVADVDLLYLDLNLVLSGIQSVLPREERDR